MGGVDNELKWCLNRGKEGGKDHKGLVKIAPNETESANHVKKAQSDLETMQYLYEGGKTDWVASAAFYAMYHSLTAILYKLGYESKNQKCTIVAIEKFMQEGMIKLEQGYISMIKEMQDDDGARSIREEMQYGSKTTMEKMRCEKLMNQAKVFVDRMKLVLAELKG